MMLAYVKMIGTLMIRTQCSRENLSTELMLPHKNDCDDAVINRSLWRSWSLVLFTEQWRLRRRRFCCGCRGRLWHGLQTRHSVTSPTEMVTESTEISRLHLATVKHVCHYHTYAHTHTGFHVSFLYLIELISPVIFYNNYIYLLYCVFGCCWSAQFLNLHRCMKALKQGVMILCCISQKYNLKLCLFHIYKI